MDSARWSVFACSWTRRSLRKPLPTLLPAGRGSRHSRLMLSDEQLDMSTYLNTVIVMAMAMNDGYMYMVCCNMKALSTTNPDRRVVYA